MHILFINIKELLQVREVDVPFVSGSSMRELPGIKNAFLRVENGLITGFGSMNSLDNKKADTVIDAREKMIELIKVYGMSESDFLKYINQAVFASKTNNIEGILEIIARSHIFHIK